MQYSIVFSSQSGNTALLAEKIKEQLAHEDCLYYGAPSQQAMTAPVIFVGFWTDKGSCDAATKAFLEKVSGKSILLFGTAGYGAKQAYFEQVLASVVQNVPRGNRLPKGFMCQGKMSSFVKARYQAKLAVDPEDTQIKALLENFEQALEHPNKEDLTHLCTWLKEIESNTQPARAL